MRWLADLILIVHFLFVAFVVGGLALTWIGASFGWQWVRNFWFRVSHLAAIVFVAGEALEPEIPAILVTGSTTPETIAEAEIRHLEVLLKPVLPDRLREAIDRRLAKNGAK